MGEIKNTQGASSGEAPIGSSSLQDCDPSRGDPFPDDKELEQQAFHACGTAPDEYRGLIRNLWQAYCSMERRAEMAIDGRLSREHVKHLKRGTTYAVLNRTGLLQTNQPLVDGDMLVTYQGSDGQWWHRPPHEFEDGRFERVSAPGMEAEGRNPLGVRGEARQPDGEAGAPQAPSSTPGEVERLVDALIQSAQEHAWTNKAGAADWGRADYEAARAEIVAARTALLSYISTAGRGEGAEPGIPSWMPQAQDVTEAMQDGGHWRSCSGCHETNEGYETGHYPYSPVYQCYVGSGCHECGGIGVIWEPPIDEAALLRSFQAESRPAAVPQDLSALSAAACPGEWCGHLLMEMTAADSDYCDALVNAHRSGRLVEASTAAATNPQDQE